MSSFADLPLGVVYKKYSSSTPQHRIRFISLFNSLLYEFFYAVLCARLKLLPLNMYYFKTFWSRNARVHLGVSHKKFVPIKFMARRQMNQSVYMMKKRVPFLMIHRHSDPFFKLMMNNLSTIVATLIAATTTTPPRTGPIQKLAKALAKDYKRNDLKQLKLSLK